MKFLTMVIFLSCWVQAGDLLDIIKREKTLKVGVDVGYQPFEMKTKKNEIIGFDMDLAKHLAKKLGVKLQIVNTEWDGIIPALLANKFHLIMGAMSISEARKKRVDFTTPYLEVGQLPLINKKLKTKIKKIEDLNHSSITVASRIGTTGEFAAKKFFPKARYKSYQDRETAALDVVFGRIDAFIYDSPYIQVFSQTRGRKRTYTFSQPFTSEPVGIAVKKNNPKFLKYLNSWLMDLKKSSYYQERVTYWFQGSQWLKDL